MSGETLHVYFLGTAGALPTPLRKPALYHESAEGLIRSFLIAVKVPSSR